jgi:5'-3' exonuclease
MAGRSIKITPEMMADAKKLIRFMGCPVIEAPCEAEA